MKLISGFTLTELMITLAVAIILLAVGIPAFNSMVANNSAAAQVNEIVTALQLARSEAAKRGLRVSLCSKGDPDPTDLSCGQGDEWVNGWLVFTDAGGNAGSYEPGAGDELLRLWPAPRANHMVAAPSSLGFTGAGELDGGSQVTIKIRFIKCTGGQNRVHTTGRVEGARINCS